MSHPKDTAGHGEAPERIWAFSDRNGNRGWGLADAEPFDCKSMPETAYVRADIPRPQGDGWLAGWKACREAAASVLRGQPHLDRYRKWPEWGSGCRDIGDTVTNFAVGMAGVIARLEPIPERNELPDARDRRIAEAARVLLEAPDLWGSLHIFDDVALAIANRIAGPRGKPNQCPDGVQVLEDAETIMRACLLALAADGQTP